LHGSAKTDTDIGSVGKLEKLNGPLQKDEVTSSVRVVSENIVNYDSHAESVDSSIDATVDNLAFDSLSQLHLDVEASQLPLKSEISTEMKNDVGEDEGVEKPFESQRFISVNPVHNQSGVDESYAHNNRFVIIILQIFTVDIKLYAKKG